MGGLKGAPVLKNFYNKNDFVFCSLGFRVNLKFGWKMELTSMFLIGFWSVGPLFGVVWAAQQDGHHVSPAGLKKRTFFGGFRVKSFGFFLYWSGCFMTIELVRWKFPDSNHRWHCCRFIFLSYWSSNSYFLWLKCLHICVLDIEVTINTEKLVVH